MALFGRNGAVHAQTSAIRRLRSEGAEEVVVTGIAPPSSSHSSRSGGDSVEEVITAKTSANAGQNIADSLKRVSGVTISSAGANEGGFDEKTVSVCAHRTSLTQTLINGHNVASGDWFVLNQTGTVAAASATRCCPRSGQQDRGGQELQSGAGGRGGRSVNIITRKPLTSKIRSACWHRRARCTRICLED